MERPILLTCTVSIQDPNVKISAHDVRLVQYQTAIKNWIRLGAKSIVICENSQERVLNAEIQTIADNNGVTIEEICFQGDTSLISKMGKGFGEGDIINNAISSSSLIKKYSCFYKITGRLWIDNIKSIDDKVSNMHNTSLFYQVDATKVDTRFFFSTVGFYNGVLRDTHKGVCDSTGKYLEHCFQAKLCDETNKIRVSVPYPKVIGLSGSTGGSYKLSIWRFGVKNILSTLMYYGKTYE